MRHSTKLFLLSTLILMMIILFLAGKLRQNIFTETAKHSASIWADSVEKMRELFIRNSPPN